MTVSTTSSTSIVQGNGLTTAFSFSFIAVSTADIEVVYTNASGVSTTLAPNSYSVILNPISPGQIWSIGGSITYPIIGAPIGNGTTLTISRVLPLTQTITIANQGDFAPEVIEEMGDTLEMQIQQVAARGGQYRGTWVTNTSYNFGDFVKDGVNGANSSNFYLCAIANTSTTWTADIAAGDWVLAIQSVFPTTTLPLSTSNGGTGAATTLTFPSTGTVATHSDILSAFSLTTSAQLGSIISDETGTGSLVFAGSPALTGLPTAPTPSAGDSSTLIATTAFVAANGTVAYSQIAGCLPSAIAGNSTTATLTISLGQAADSTNAVYIISAGYSWAVSNGNAINGYQGGSTLPNSSTIHFFVCRGNSGTASFASTSLTPSLPAGYSTYYRRIFSIKTTAGGALIPYSAVEVDGGAVQAYLATQVLDYNSTISGTSSLITFSIPIGIKLQLQFHAIATTAAYNGILITSPDETDVFPSISAGGGYNGATPGFNLNSTGAGSGLYTSSFPHKISNTSGQLRFRATASTAIQVVTEGFKDFRR